MQDEVIPDDVPLMELADRVVRGKIKLSPPQQRMLIEMLPYIAPKLSATAIASLNGEDFASALDRCIARSGIKPTPLPPPKVIEHEPPVSAEEMKRPFSNYRNNYRRF